MYMIIFFSQFGTVKEFLYYLRQRINFETGCKGKKKIPAQSKFNILLKTAL